MTTPIRVAVTGAGGQIGYALLVPDRLRSGLRARPAGRAAAPGNHARPAGAARHADGAGGLRLPAPGRHRRRPTRPRRRSRGPTG